ncbi:Sel1 domain-containing protein [Escherichia coli]|uniref:Sel1 domain-containing protein n=1 Tax=Escherichia coli TaxID=562 RepID=A0A377BAB1_ECOLX|nr:Sel1 domain-containing protein [Escherichia coli]
MTRQPGISNAALPISRTGYSEYWAGMMFLNGEEGFIEKNKQKALHWLNLSCMEGFDTGV